ncbi:MAG: hypothetical protein R3248_08785 [Candidatus Promineifilaceae bacterium]|nr:hypothetical protein [Candidatus Promineifilaceae bacterium]
MNLFTIAGIVGVAIIFLGTFLAGAFVTLSRMVKENQAAISREERSVNPSMTFGFEIPVDADITEQLKKARKLAAARAAAQARGANMRIGRLGHEQTKGASKELDADPLSAVKIASFHGWQGAKQGPPAGGVPEQAQAAVTQPQVAPSKKPEDLVPGEDYEYTEITDDMSPDEVRQARIANARARSAAVKALKQQQQAAPAAQPAPAEQAQQPAAEAKAEAVEVPSHITEPDYVEITDDMSADEVRKARIQNARARSAYMKALKDAGIDPKEAMAAKERGEPVPTPAKEEAPAPEAAEAPAEEAAPEPEAETAPAAEGETVEIPAHISEPDYVEITDDMSPDEVRRARVQNSRERSRYFKELKEAGIDPKKVADQQ